MKAYGLEWWISRYPNECVYEKEITALRSRLASEIRLRRKVERELAELRESVGDLLD